MQVSHNTLFCFSSSHFYQFPFDSVLVFLDQVRNHYVDHSIWLEVQKWPTKVDNLKQSRQIELSQLLSSSKRDKRSKKNKVWRIRGTHTKSSLQYTDLRSHPNLLPGLRGHQNSVVKKKKLTEVKVRATSSLLSSASPNFKEKKTPQFYLLSTLLSMRTHLPLIVKLIYPLTVKHTQPHS